jgi:hypothetical protein
VRDRPRARTAPLVRSPCRGDRFPRSMQEPEPSSRHLHAGRHLGSQQAPPRLIPGLQSIPGFDVNFVFRHVISGSLSLAFLARTCRAQRRDFSRDAHHRGSLPQQLAVVCGLRLHGGHGGPPGQTHPAPPSPAQHRIQNLGLLHPASFNVCGTPRDDSRASRPALARPLLRHGQASVWRVGAQTSAARPTRQRAAHSGRVPELL